MKVKEKTREDTKPAPDKDEAGRSRGSRPESPPVGREPRGRGAAADRDFASDSLISVLNEAPDIIAVWRESKLLFVNRLFQEILGYGRDKTESVPPLQFVHPDDRLVVHEQCLKIARGHNLPGGCSFRIVSSDGNEVWFHMKASAVTWNGEPAILAFLRDMTHQNMLEARLVQAQKLEALGTLSEGIAHDFNNMLMSIQGYASLALQEQGLPPSIANRLNKIQEIVRSGANLTSKLLGFSGTACHDVLPVDLNEVVQSASIMVEHFNRDITLYRDLCDDLLPVVGDRGQIEQVLMNLLVNACQAMPGGGDLFLETSNCELSTEIDGSTFLGIPPGTYVRISLADTGTGMDESLMKRIFDPFFSTREGSIGTGLGLPSAYGIVRAHGGTIDVTSAPGQGSRFDVYLPVVRPSAQQEGSPESSQDRGKTRATILIVDDEEVVLEVNRELLQSLGYRVFEAQSGREALAVYHRAGEEIDLVILDLVMPGMSGAETFQALRAINPRIKVLLLSGYSIEGGAEELLKQGCRAYVQKPFTLGNLERKIEEVLNEP